MNLPSLLEPNPSQDCFCPSCLAKATAKAIDQKINDKTHQEMLELASVYNNKGGFVEHIDYTIENGNYVFTKWYHLKRGQCCDSGCRNCPF